MPTGWYQYPFALSRKHRYVSGAESARPPIVHGASDRRPAPEAATQHHLKEPRPTSPHPQDLAEQARWATLDAFARSDELFADYVLKGGLALRYAYGSPRRSDDLDFDAIADHDRGRSEAYEHELIHFCHELDSALAEVGPHYGFSKIAVQRKQLSDEIPTLLGEIGYGIGADPTTPLPQSIPMQVTLCEVVCEVWVTEVEGIRIHVPTLEDILAEKVKAMAQQVQRSNARSSDVFDIWYFLQQRSHTLDIQKLGSYLKAKARPLGLAVSGDLFRGDILRAFSGSEYADLAADLPDGFQLPPFEEAYAEVVRLVDAVGPSPTHADDDASGAV